MNLEEFNLVCSQFDVKKASKEVLSWLIDNHMNYIDNSDTAYVIYFCGESLKEVPSLKYLQELYEKMPEDEKYIDEYQNLTNSILIEMKNDKKSLSELFEKLICFYDTKIISDGNVALPYIEPLDGYVEISTFLYEPFPVEVVVTNKNAKDGDSVKKTTIPEGFCVQFEISYWKPVQATTSFSVM